MLHFTQTSQNLLIKKKPTFYTYIKKEIGLQKNETTPCQLQVTSMKKERFYQLKWRSKMLEATRDMERTVDTLVISSS